MATKSNMFRTDEIVNAKMRHGFCEEQVQLQLRLYVVRGLITSRRTGTFQRVDRVGNTKWQHVERRSVDGPTVNETGKVVGV